MNANARIAPPIHVAWEITRRCNANCLHCSSAAGPDFREEDEISTEDALDFINQFAAAGVRVLALTGGEPLLRPDLIALIRHAAQRGLTTHLCTNGLLVNLAMALRLKDADLHGITVSLDGACAETHDRLRDAPGLFELALEAIKCLKQYHHRVGISFTPTLINYQETLNVIDLAYEFGAESVCVSQYIPTGRGTRELMLTPTLLEALARDVLKARRAYSKRLQIYCHDCHVALLLAEDERQHYQGCGAGIATAGIRCNGALTPCILMPTDAGNLHHQRFDEIWEKSPQLVSLRDREQLQQGNCRSCEFKLICGGCRAAALAIHGHPMAGDPSCWLFPQAAHASLS